MDVNLCDLFPEDRVVEDITSSDKEGVLKELLMPLRKFLAGGDIGPLLKMLLDREKLSSTAVGHSVALPHVKTENVPQILGVFGRSKKGVDFGSVDGMPVHIFALIVAPQKDAALHLRALAKVSKLLLNGGTREKIMAAENSAAIHELLCRDTG